MATNEKLDAILGKLDAIAADVAEFKTGAALREQRISQLETAVEGHDHILEGNGTAGLKTEVARLADKVGDMATRWNILTGLVGVQIVAIIFGMLTHTFVFNP